MILGLDLSTSCIGWCTLVDTGHFIDVGHLEFKKEKSLYVKLDRFSELLKRIASTRVTYEMKVFVEAPLARSNNQNVVNLLQRWNGMCCAEIYRIFKKEPVLIANRDILKVADIKVPKGVKGKDRKKYILQCVQNLAIIPEGKWQLKKTGNPKDFCFDQADSYLIALAGSKQL
jgi:hypothetical protein